MVVPQLSSSRTLRAGSTQRHRQSNNHVTFLTRGEARPPRIRVEPEQLSVIVPQAWPLRAVEVNNLHIFLQQEEVEFGKGPVQPCCAAVVRKQVPHVPLPKEVPQLRAARSTCRIRCTPSHQFRQQCHHHTHCPSSNSRAPRIDGTRIGATASCNRSSGTR